ncbi:MAG TPA: ATP-binding protein [Gemmataceae bacterium]|jgi:signal transduction histidine kinase|nr:ATP-binding protein [Gemmataceae bacterium]
MTGQILYRVALPAVLVIVLLVAACLGGAWSIATLQANQARILSKNVSSLLAAQELELRLRQLRFHSFVYVMEPTEVRKKWVNVDIRQFEEALAKAEQTADQPEERQLVESVKEGYQEYCRKLGHGPVPGAEAWSREQLLRWADDHPMAQLAARCEVLSGFNDRSMAETAAASNRIGDRTREWMLLVGGLGPLSGLAGGYLIARGLGRTLTRLVVRVQDLNAQLDQEVDSLGLNAGTRLQDLDRQLDHVVERVRTVVVQAQRQQQEMLRAEQLAAVGQLAAGLAHEIRNPLTSVKLLIGAARSRSGDKALSPEDLQVIHQEIERLEARVQTLLDFARPMQSRRRTRDLRELVGSTIELVRSRARQQGVSIEYSPPPDTVNVCVDPDQISSVLVNLYFNALDAMPGGGHLTIHLIVAGQAELTITDDGQGIDPELTERLFTPFVSSKSTGTGLGLSVSRRIVEDHGGTLTGANRVGVSGACFTVRLPVSGDGHADSPPRR